MQTGIAILIDTNSYSPNVIRVTDSGTWIPESGAFLLVESEIRGNSACGIRNPGLWNLEYSSRNSESH